MKRLESFVSSSLSHRNALIELIEQVNDEQLSFKPWESGMSLAELVIHTVGATKMFSDTVKNGVFTPPSNTGKINTVAELREFCMNITEETKNEVSALNDEQLQKLIHFNGMDLPGMAILELAKEHEIHHKGQLFTYARLLGIEKVPFFISR